MTKKTRTLVEAAAEILSTNLKDKGLGEPFGAGFNRPDSAQLAGKMKADGPTDHGTFVGGPVVDPTKSGIDAAKNAGPRATPPGTSPQAKSHEDMHNIKSGESGVEGKAGGRAKTHDDGVVTEEEEEESKKDIAEEGEGGDHHNQEKNLDHESYTITPEKGGWKGAPLAPGEQPGFKQPVGGKDEVSAMPVSDRVKSYVKSKGAGLAVSEDINSIFGEQGLSEDFQKRARLVFEAAVIATATKVCEGIEQEYVTQLENITESQKNQMATKLDEYMSYMTEEWLKENKVAVGSTLRADLADSFMKGLHALFLEHFIDVPEDKVDLVEEFADEIETLKGRLNEAIEANVGLKKSLDEQKKVEIVAQIVEGLTDVQKSKIKSLVEAVEFTNPEDFQKNAQVIKETYVPSKEPKKGAKTLMESDARETKDQTTPTVIVEDKKTDGTVESDDPNINHYLKALARTQPTV